MNHDLPASLRQALHRIDALSPLAPPKPPPPRHRVARGPAARNIAFAVAATASVAVAAVVVMSDPWSDSPAEARYGVVETTDGTAMFLPAAIPGSYELVAAQRLDPDPADRGATIVTGRIAGDAITEWTSASTSPPGLGEWFSEEELEVITTSGRSYRATSIDGELVLDFATETCGVVTVTTAATDVDATAAAADRIQCDDGALGADFEAGHELLYSGPRNTAPDDGLVLTFESDAADEPAVRLHLRRFGYPPDLIGLTYEGGPDQQFVGGKEVTIMEADDATTIAWSFAPDNLIVVSSPAASAVGILAEFLDQLAPATSVEMQRLCSSVGAPDCI